MMKHHRLCRKGWGRKNTLTSIHKFFKNRFLFAFFLLFCLFDVLMWCKHDRECCHFAPDSLCQWHHNVWQKWRQNVWQKCQTREKGHPVCFPFIEWICLRRSTGGDRDPRSGGRWRVTASWRNMHSIIRKVTFLFHLYFSLKRALSPRGGYSFSLNHFPPPCWHTPVIIWQVGQVTLHVNNISILVRLVVNLSRRN